MHGPDPTILHPLEGFPQVCFIKNVIKNPNIVVGDYTYYDDPEDLENFERNVLYHYPFIGDKLVIGKFCAIARGVKFIMNGKQRFSPEAVETLQAIAWWDWPVEKITQHLALIVAGDVEALRRYSMLGSMENP